MNIWPLIITLLIIGAAELGDKTQLMTLTFAAKYPVWEVISAVSAASAVLMAIAVLFGSIIDKFIPPVYIQLLAGTVFIFFGIWTIFGKDKDAAAQTSGKNPFWIIFATFFVAELGDKTQLATLALSAKYSAPIQVWIGATLGMIGVNAVAAVAGTWVKKYVSEKAIRWAGAAIFIGFGFFTFASILL